MKPDSALSGEALVQLLGVQFSRVPEHRTLGQVEIPLKDFLMSGYAIFAMKFPSLLQYDEDMRKLAPHSSLQTLFNIGRLPSDTQMRAVLDEVNPEQLRRSFRALFARAQRQKVLEGHRLFNGKYLVPIDGSGYFYSDAIHCASCCEKSLQAGGTAYYHQMLTGVIAHPEKATVIPFCPEPIKKQDPTEKQNDSEKSAFARFISRLHDEHPRLKVMINTDALHTNAVNIRLLKSLGMSFIMSVKPGSHEKLFEMMETWETYGATKAKVVEEEIGDKIKKHRMHEFRYANGTILNHSGLDFAVNFIDYRETTQWVNQKGDLKSEVTRFTWVTDEIITDENTMALMRAGRARWKIENETFNTLKNHGYEFEHNFGHGYKNLTTNFAYLMMLAFTVDQLQEIASLHFQEALKRCLGKRSRLWREIKGLYLARVLIASYTQLIDVIAHPECWKLTLNSS
jgi:hypothetical protein